MKNNTSLPWQRSAVGYCSILSAAAVFVVAIAFHRRIVFAILEEFAALGREELINREIYAVEQVTRVIISCTYPI